VMIGADGTGTGDARWAQELLRRIKTTPNIEYLGARSQAEVNKLLARSHLFINTSLHEGFPNTFIQAWMREVPVVSLHVDPDGLLEKNQIGIFCGDDESRLADAVRRLISDGALRSRYAAKARAYAMSQHSMANATGLAQLFDTCGAPA
jgi:glycosyltransferase involved in cell wall biosynthesis